MTSPAIFPVVVLAAAPVVGLGSLAAPSLHVADLDRSVVDPVRQASAPSVAE